MSKQPELHSFTGQLIELDQNVIIKNLAGGEHEFLWGRVISITNKTVLVETKLLDYWGKPVTIRRKPEQVITGTYL